VIFLWQKCRQTFFYDVSSLSNKLVICSFDICQIDKSDCHVVKHNITSYTKESSSILYISFRCFHPADIFRAHLVSAKWIYCKILYLSILCKVLFVNCYLFNFVS